MTGQMLAEQGVLREWVKERARFLGLSVTGFAKRAGVAASTLNRFVAGTSPGMTTRTLACLQMVGPADGVTPAVIAKRGRRKVRLTIDEDVSVWQAERIHAILDEEA